MADQAGLIQLDPPAQVTSGSTTTSPAAPAPSAMPVPPVTSYTPVSATPGSANATGYQATPYTVDPTKGTVQGQLDGLLQKGSPYLEAAVTPSQQAMNDRGLLNSSIGLGAAETARINAALPIANADATIYNQAMTNSTNQQNAASQFGAGAENSAAQLNAQLLSSMNTTNANAKNGALSQEAQAANARSLAAIDTNTRMQLATLDTQNRALLQTSTGASNAYVQAVTNIANIATNNTLSKEAKDAATATQMNMLNEQLRTLAGISVTPSPLVASLNLDQYFKSLVPATPAPAPAPVDPNTQGHWGTDANGNQVWMPGAA